MTRRKPLVCWAIFVCGLALGGCAGCDGEDARGADAFEFAPDTDGDRDITYRPGWELQTVAGGVRAKIDFLWVIDNSSSMCSEQRALHTGYRRFIEKLTEEPVDFHIAVTTTHNIYGTEPLPGQPYVDRHLFTSDDSTSEDSPGAPVPEAGQIQRFPNPTLGLDDACLSGPHSNEEDDVDERSIQRVETQLNRAIACTKNPAQYEQFSDDVVDGEFEELTECALFDEPETGGGEDDREICEDIGKSDDYGVEELTAEIFPCGQKLGKPCKTPEEFRQVYRELPTILRSRDYTGPDGILDKAEIQELRRDFACMSLVGTRGSDYEQGLRNAALAVHPLMTGGPARDPFEGRTFEHPVTGEKRTIEDGTSRPNHGFLRSDAATLLVFDTD